MSRFHGSSNSRAYRVIVRQCLNRANWRCERCGLAGRLQVHHVKPLHRGGDHTLANCTALCRLCHTAHHRRDRPTGSEVTTPDKPEPTRKAHVPDPEWEALVDELTGHA